MRIIESRSIDNQAGLLGSRLITGTSTIEGAFQSFIVAEDTVVTKVYNSIGIDVTGRLGLTSITLKAGAFISMPKNDYFSSIKLTSGSVVAYFVSHGGMTITAQAYLNEFLARIGSSYIEAEDCVKNHLQQLINIGLLQKASLVMSPSMYEEDLVKSVVPQDGSGDLSFTRASNGTRINFDGLVEVCPWNLVQNSENFSIDFIPINLSISNNTTTAPNGTTTADSLIENTATDNHFAFADSTQQSGVEYTYSVYAKSIGGRNIRVFGSSGFGGDLIVDLANGSVLNGSGVVQSVGNGWYRISITATTTTATVRAILYIVNGTSISYTGNGTSGIFLWGAQLNIGSTAKPYFPTTDRLNVPRLTYQNGGGGCPSLLLEKQSTNVLQYSEQFENAVYDKTGAAITANSTTSPDGTTNADSFIEDSSTGFHFLQQTFVALATSYTYTIYAKNASGTRKLVLREGVSTGAFGTFDLVNGTVTNSGAGATASIESVGNGWYRCAVTFTAVVGASTFQIFISNASTFASYTGNGTSGFYLYGAQVEASSYFTSYIPTTSASATRVADACFKTGISSLIGQTEGVMFVDFLTSGLPSIDQYFMNISDGSTSNIIYIGFYANILVARIIDAGSLLVNINVGLATNTRYKVGFAYKANDCVLYINGSNSGSDTSTTIPATSKLSYNDFSNEACYQLNESVLFKTRLSNSELASLTTL